MTTSDKPQPGTADQGVDLDAQLDELLDQIDHTPPESPAAMTRPQAFAAPHPDQGHNLNADLDQEPADSVDDDEMDFSQDDFVPVDQIPMDPVGLDLANEIQQLLNDDRPPNSTAPQNSHVKPPSQPAGPNTSPTSDTGQRVERNAQSDSPGSLNHDAPQEDAAVPPVLANVQNQQARPTPASPETASASTPEPGSKAGLSLEDIDDMLAQEADDAVAGDFETVSQVAQAQNSEPAGTRDQTTAQASAGQPAGGSHGTADDTDEDELEGSFQSPEDLIAAAAAYDHQRQTDRPASAPRQPGKTGLSPDALAVARELDEQPENDPARIGSSGAPGSASAASAPSQSAASTNSSRPSLLQRLVGQTSVLRRVCTSINRPLENVSSQTRDMVGYAGLITLFWGTATIAVKIIAAMVH